MNYNKAKKNDLLFELLRTVVAILISIVIVIIIIMIVSGNPGEAIYLLFIGPLTNLRRIGNVIELAIPLTFCGLALSLNFRARQFNLIADGAFFAGAMAATVIGLYMDAPAIVVILTALIGGTVLGGALGAIPAVMKRKLGAMELVTSLMMNYVISHLVLYVLINKVRDADKMALQSLALPNNVNLGTLIPGTRIHFGLILVILCVVGVSIFLFKTKGGYALRMTGTNQNFAFYSGIPVAGTIIGAQVMGAALAGLGGATELLGMYNAFRYTTSPRYGFDGVIIATLARNNPALVPIAAIFLAYIRTGADILNRSSDISYEIVSVIQASIILLIAAKAFLGGLKQKSLVRQTIEVKGGGEA